jgi:acyl-CoA synthetase (AMP-forming)/AMP-acid ligase II
MYGATEASARLTYLEPDRFVDKIDSIGKPIPGVSLRVLNGNRQEVPVGQAGEIVGCGPNIMQGYWKDERASAEVLDKNGYHTGDLGYQDAEGYFYVVGRKDNLIKVGGHRINPQEIEDILIESNLLIEAVVLGIQDELLGHKLVTLVVPRSDGCSENKILNYCAERLPRYKLPSRVELINTLPKSPSGKADRAKCLELLNKTEFI